MPSLLNRIARAGPSGIVRAIIRRIRPVRAASSGLVERAVAGRRGLEIGGPSGMFAAHGPLPVYPVVAALDNCNFGRVTAWEGAIDEGLTFEFRRGGVGRQFILEASDLKAIDDEAYDFVLSSHTIEHVANPLGTLREWIRVIRPGGAVVLVIPHRDGTFDHRRPVTTLAHLRDDESRGTREDDLTHLEEILALHDLSLDPGAGSATQFRARCAANAENRCLHHHVFDTDLAVRVIDAVGLQVEAVETLRPHHIIILAHRPVDVDAPRNDTFLAPSAHWRVSSAFPSDRRDGSS